MPTLTPSPAAQFHAALLGPEAQRLLGEVPLTYLVELYPVLRPHTNAEYAWLICKHIDGWLGTRTFLNDEAVAFLDDDTYRWLRERLVEIDDYNVARGQTRATFHVGVRKVLRDMLRERYLLAARPADLLSNVLVAMMWLKLVVYDEDRMDTPVRLASEIWQVTAPA